MSVPAEGRAGVGPARSDEQPASRGTSAAAAFADLFGGWEVAVIVVMLLLYAAGTLINPAFFGSSNALLAVLRDAARFGVIAVGMSFVIVQRDLDLSVGSTVGLVAVLFSLFYAPAGADQPAWFAAGAAIIAGLLIGLTNGLLVTKLKVPAFIATLAMLFIGRGLVLGLTGGQEISYPGKAGGDPFFWLGQTGIGGINNQVLVFLMVAVIGALLLGRTVWGYETYATGGNAEAAERSGTNTDRVRIRGFVLSALCATLAGLMNVAQDMTVTSQYGVGAELIVIAAVIVGGASIAGGRGRVIGSCLGAILVVLIDRVLREGFPTVRVLKIGDVEMKINAMAQLPPGAVPAFLGLVLLAAVLIEPWLIRSGLLARIVARLRGRPAPPLSAEGVAIVGVQTRATAAAGETSASPIARLFARREVAAVLLAVVLWLAGVSLRPDYWASLDNSFNLMLAFTEVALLAIGMTFVIANGDVDLSVGAVLAMSGATAAFLMREMNAPPLFAALTAFAVGTLAGVVNGMLSTKARLPAFVATLGMFYIARGLGAWLVAGRQLSGFPEGFNLIGRKLIEVLTMLGMAPDPGTLAYRVAAALSVQTIIMLLIAVAAGLVLAKTRFGYAVIATGGNRRAAEYAGINTDRVRFLSLLFSAMCAALAGVIYIAFYRSFNPSAGQLRELDAIAAVIVGGGSIFGGYGSVLGSLAGAAAITLIRALLSLQLILPSGKSFIMPQHWVNVFIGIILIVAVLSDIWLRQEQIFTRLRRRLSRRHTVEHHDG
jgi:ribose transport system permease protein